MSDTATIAIDGTTLDCPVTTGTMNERGIDIAKLRATTGAITLDPGLGNTGSCSSSITYINGEKGILQYRGIPIEAFADSPNFVEVALLLIYGHLPTHDEYGKFSALLGENAHLHEGMRHHFEGFPLDSPPMAILSAMTNVLACYHPHLLQLENDDDFLIAAARLISKIRTIAAYSYRRSRGLPLNYPDAKLPYCSNFLHMMFTMPYAKYQEDPVIRQALDLVLLLHADHEQNCSTSTVRVVGSSKANLFASVAAGISALWGPLHGGANVAVVNMLNGILEGGLSAENCLEKAKDKNDPFKLMGFGHRVYKNFDPRARMLQAVCEQVFARLNINDPLLNIARSLEEKALNDAYFRERNLYPNVDFYSGILLRALGIPTNMFTVIFSMGRLPGWIAHWKEQHDDPTVRITRPRQIYTGKRDQPYVPMDKRG